MSITVTKDSVDAVLQSIQEMASKRVVVGVPMAKTERGEKISNAALAYIHDNGSPAANIPARPFLKPGVDAVKGKCAQILKQAGKKAIGLRGTVTIDKALNACGLLAQTSVKKTIRAGEGFEPLSMRTLKARERDGRKGTKPLIRTGQLLNSISYAVRKK